MGQPTFNVKEGADPYKESNKHYMTYHFKEPENAKKERERHSNGSR